MYSLVDSALVEHIRKPMLSKTGKNSERPSVQAIGSGMVLDANDEDVIEACQRGDADAFRALFETV